MMEELASEVSSQASKLGEYAARRLPQAPRGSVFVGAGDSYAAALAGFYASRGKCVAFDPYALATEPEAARGSEVFFISVSGRTASNLLALSKVRGIAKKTTVVTAVEDSPLVEGSDEFVTLPMNYVPRTPGLLSFSLSALAVLKLVGDVGHCDFEGVYEGAKQESRKLSLANGTTYFLGNSLGHAAATYAAAKVYEMFGSPAHAEALEQFSHMELLSLRPIDSVNIFSAFDPEGIAHKLGQALSSERYRSTLVPSAGKSPVELFFHLVFVTQLWCLAEAKREGLEAPKFLGNERRLRISDSMIY
jgi:fructoselysine-6-P-deglycase FrlB-like protein